MPVAREKPIAAGVPESGIGSTRSALDRRLGRQPLAHRDPGAVHLDAVEARVGPGEVEELEQAEGARGRLRRTPGTLLDAVLVGDQQLARGDVALELGADEVERAGLRGDDGIVAEPAEHERTEAVRVAEGEQLALGQPDHRRRALDPARARRRSPRAAARGLQEIIAAITSLSEVDASRGRSSCAQRVGVDEVAVVPEGDRAGGAVVDERLRVRPGVRAGRRVAGVADRELAREPRELALVEHLGDEAQVAQSGQPALVGDGDAGRLLAAVLERAEPEVGEPGDVAAGGAGAEDAAHQTRPSSSAPAKSSALVVLGARVTITPGPVGAGERGLDAAPARRPRAARRRPRGDVVGEGEAVGVAPDERDELGARARAGRRRGRRAASATGRAARSRTSPTQPTTGVGGIGRPPVSL